MVMSQFNTHVLCQYIAMSQSSIPLLLVLAMSQSIDHQLLWVIFLLFKFNELFCCLNDRVWLSWYWRILWTWRKSQIKFGCVDLWNNVQCWWWHVQLFVSPIGHSSNLLFSRQIGCSENTPCLFFLWMIGISPSTQDLLIAKLLTFWWY